MQIKEVDVEKTEIFSIGRQYSHNFYNDGTKIGITLQDGLHPNAIGQQMLARAIIGKLNSCYYPID